MRHAGYGDPTMELAAQFASLVEHPRYSAATWREETTWQGLGYLITIPMALPAGWDHTVATVTFYIGAYGGWPRCFWTAETVMLEGDRWPRLVMGEPTKPRPSERFPEGCRWYWLWSPTAWSACSDTLLTYAHFIRQRFHALE